MYVVPRRLLCSVLLGSFLLVAALGCGESVSTVSGEVKVNDKPLPDGIISFASQGKKKKVREGIIKDGKYSVSDVPVGDTIVTVKETSTMTAPAPAKGSSKTATPPKPTTLIPAKYGDPRTSGLTYTVQAGENVYNPPIQAEAPPKKK
jgi:hypothetical protein